MTEQKIHAAAISEGTGPTSGALTGAPGSHADPIFRTIERLAGSSDLSVLVQEVARSLVERFEAELAEVWVVTAPGAPFTRRGVLARDGEAPESDPILAQRYGSLADPFSGPVPETGDGFSAWARKQGITQVHVRPMQAAGRVTGALAVYSRAPLAAELVPWLQVYSAMAAVALVDTQILAENHKAITQLQFLVEASQVLNSTLDLAELLDLILNLACKEINAERGSVFLVDREQREIWTILAHGLEKQEIRLSFGQGVAGHVAETGQVLNVADAYDSPYFDRSFDERFNFRTRNLLCTPIRNRTGETVGILQLLNKRAGRFTTQDEEFLGTLSVHMALALENARLHRELLEKQRLERELQLARGIQRSLLPDAPPSITGYDIAVLNEPCFEVGGDYYDFLTLGPHTLLLVVADVEGKGVSSALVMSNLQATLRALVMHLHSLEVITLSLNEMILADTRSEKFLSIFLGLVDTRRRGLHYINAGHIPPIVVRADGSVLTLEEGGMVIGLFNAVEYRRGSLRLEAGDVILCCTDGIIEASDPNGDEFGQQRLVDAVQRYRHLSAQEVVERIAAEVTAYARGGSHIDDKVLMVMKVLEDLDPKV